MRGLIRPRVRRPGWLYRVMTALIGLLAPRLHVSCRAFMRLASEKYERPVRPAERTRQSMHRATCRIRRVQERRMDQPRLLAQDVARHGADDVQATLPPESVHRMRRAMTDATQDRPDGGSKR